MLWSKRVALASVLATQSTLHDTYLDSTQCRYTSNKQKYQDNF